MLRIVLAAACLLTTAVVSEAGCVYGRKNLPGSLGPGQDDSSRSFTINRSARFTVRVRRGGPITANLGCGWVTGYNISCRVFGHGETFVSLQNNTGRQTTYRWICRH